MNRFVTRLALALALAPVLVAGGVAAAPQDYRFVVAGHARQADGSDIVMVRLVRLPDGKPVPGAIVFAPKAAMGSGGTAMTTPAKMLAPAADGAAAVHVATSMDGPWTLSLSARVNGEAAVISGSVDVVLGR